MAIPNNRSLCWYCKKSSPSKCEWIRSGKKVYKKAATFNKILVKECDRFELQDTLSEREENFFRRVAN